jgi:multimeric flavodoxin WrbA
LNLLAFTGSPRKESISSKLHNEFLNPFVTNGSKMDIINAYQININPCMGCGYCASNLRCSFDDGMVDIYSLIKEADIISVSSPLYFSYFPAPLKMIIDRCQLLWEEKRNNMPIREKRGVFFCTAGSDYGDIFCSVLTGIKHFFNTINAEFDINESILLKNCDYIDTIPSDILESCHILGKKYSI